MKQHAKSALPRIESNTADRDCFLTSQDMRKIAQKLARLTWKLHDNEAQSVRLFYQQHSECMCIYQEERSAQPQPAACQPAAPASQPSAPASQPSSPASQPVPAPDQPAAAAAHQSAAAGVGDSMEAANNAQLQHPQKLIIGWLTPFMKANLLKCGNNSIVLLDATFGTNHMKMPLYTGLVMDDFSNGVPAFMVLCQGTTQQDIAKWLAALLQSVRREEPDWMCSCVMVEYAIAEINAIR